MTHNSRGVVATAILRLAAGDPGMPKTWWADAGLLGFDKIQTLRADAFDTVMMQFFREHLRLTS
jgi:hypothetical protein